MIGLPFVYAVAGVAFGAAALLSARDRRWGNAAFQGLVALSLFAGDLLGDLGNGVLALALAGVAVSGRMRGRVAETAPAIAGGPLLALALVVPVAAVIGTLLFKQVPALVDPKQATLVALACGVLLALAAAHAILRPPVLAVAEAGRGMFDDIGWAVVLPQLLASLGAVFAVAGVGTAVGSLVTAVVPSGSLLGAVLVYGLGMAAFTIVMGNAFAAFPVMAAAVGIPMLVHQHGGSPAAVAAIGMLAGFCGTLLTPMAANFNLVPAALLELRDRYGVIRAQAPTALVLLGFNLLLLWLVIR